MDYIVRFDDGTYYYSATADCLFEFDEDNDPRELWWPIHGQREATRLDRATAHLVRKALGRDARVVALFSRGSV